MGDGRRMGDDDGWKGRGRDGAGKNEANNSRPGAVSRVDGAKPQHTWCLSAATNIPVNNDYLRSTVDSSVKAARVSTI